MNILFFINTVNLIFIRIQRTIVTLSEIVHEITEGVLSLSWNTFVIETVGETKLLLRYKYFLGCQILASDKVVITEFTGNL
jgi:hypothetical protein